MMHISCIPTSIIGELHVAMVMYAYLRYLSIVAGLFHIITCALRGVDFYIHAIYDDYVFHGHI